MDKEYEDTIMRGIHQSAQDLYEIGVIDAAKMRKFDEACLVSNPETERESEEMGQFSPAAV